MRVDRDDVDTFCSLGAIKLTTSMISNEPITPRSDIWIGPNVTNRRLELSHQSKNDIRDILSYTLANWGESQLAKYRASIDEPLHVIL